MLLAESLGTSGVTASGLQKSVSKSCVFLMQFRKLFTSQITTSYKKEITKIKSMVENFLNCNKYSAFFLMKINFVYEWKYAF